MDRLKIGKFQIAWLDGGKISLDGGGVFGVVPKMIWSKKYPCNDLNQVELRTDPILIQANGQNILIDTGMGSGKLDEKQKRRYGVVKESKIEQSLKEIGLSPENIDHVVLTHFHNDHTAGLTRLAEEQYLPVFKQAAYYVQAVEWEAALQPNNRTRNTYLKENWQPIKSQVHMFGDRLMLMDGIELIHTGGHSEGHTIVRIESQGEIVYHLADILPTHAHKNPLWVMAYDDYPMDVISAKETWIEKGIEEGAWFTFYHDNFYRALKWNTKGEVVAEIKTS